MILCLRSAGLPAVDPIDCAQNADIALVLARERNQRLGREP
jgi:hypothetical protein